MESDATQATQDSRQEQAASDAAGRFFAQMADRVGINARAEIAFGAPVERGSITVVPVARARWGFGGGRDRRAREGGGSGSGGGGGVIVQPVGYIEISAAGTRFRRIVDANSIAVMTAAAALLLVAVRRLWTAR